MRGSLSCRPIRGLIGLAITWWDLIGHGQMIAVEIMDFCPRLSNARRAKTVSRAVATRGSSRL